MRKLEAAVALREGLPEHPATRAWRQLRPAGVPSEIRILKERSKGIQKSAVYWLADAGVGGRPVIAKRCLRGAAKVEALIYREFLGELSLPAPDYHGMVDDGGPFCWLFMDYVPGERYSPADPEHRRLAARWIARLHGEAESLPGTERLPDVGVTHYLRRLRQARDAIVEHTDDPSLSPGEASTLRRLAALLGELEVCWPRLETACSELPRTLVHGDLTGNLRVHAAGAGAVVLVFDWETAGWGPPAVDLARSVRAGRLAPNPCLDTYRSACRSAAGLTREDVDCQAATGTILRCLTAIHWTSMSLGPPWRDCPEDVRREFVKKRGKTLPCLELYLESLEYSWRLVSGPGERVIARGTAPAVHQGALRRLVRDALPHAGVAANALVDVEQAVSPNTTSYTTVAVTARLRGGRAMRLFLKDFGYSRLPKDSADGRRLREVHVYRDLLADTGLGSPEYYGSLWDEAGDRTWLLLEFVDGVQLRDCGFDAWIPSAAWLARLHAHFAARMSELERSPLLLRHDESYFRSKADNALREVERFSGRSRRRAADLVSGYDELATVMASEPQTLVHGNYRSKNIVVERSTARVRVAPVDWEVAAIGSPLYDLGHLLDGYRGERLQALLDAYSRQAHELGLSITHDDEALRRMDAFCLHRVVKSLARAVEKGFDERDVGKLLDHGEALRGRISG